MKDVWMLTGNPSNRLAVQTARSFAAHARRKGALTHFDDGFIEGKKNPAGKKPELVVVFGGDGSLFHAARNEKWLEASFAGVNCGRKGHLMAISPRHLGQAVDALLKRRFPIETHIRLDISDGIKNLGTAINDAVIAPSKSAIVMKYDCSIGDESFPGIGDGVIVSTPLGSTAYARSTGSPVVLSGASVLLVSPINPIEQSHRLIVPANEIIYFSQLRTNRGHVEVILDGQERICVEQAIIRVSKKPFHLVQFQSPRENKFPLSHWGAATQLVFLRISLDGPIDRRGLVQATGLSDKTIRKALAELGNARQIDRENISGRKKHSRFVLA